MPSLSSLPSDDAFADTEPARYELIARRCERAVVTAYRELRGIGTGDRPAFGACVTLYRIHHPEASLQEARLLVSEWIDHHITGNDETPTSGCECATDG